MCAQAAARAVLGCARLPSNCHRHEGSQVPSAGRRVPATARRAAGHWWRAQRGASCSGWPVISRSGWSRATYAASGRLSERGLSMLGAAEGSAELSPAERRHAACCAPRMRMRACMHAAAACMPAARRGRPVPTTAAPCPAPAPQCPTGCPRSPPLKRSPALPPPPPKVHTLTSLSLRRFSSPPPPPPPPPPHLPPSAPTAP